MFECGQIYPRENPGAGGGGEITCTYPLDATAAQISSMGFTKPTVTNNDTSATINLTTGSAIEYLAAPASFFSGTGATPLNGSVTICNALRLDNIPFVTGASGANSQIYGQLRIGDSVGNILEVGFEVRTSASNVPFMDIYHVVGGIRTNVKSNLRQPAYLIGLYIDQNTNQYGAIVDGDDLGLIGSYAFSEGWASIGFFQPNTVDANYSGLTTTITRLSVASQMIQPFPAGATDFCGNAI